MDKRIRLGPQFQLTEEILSPAKIAVLNSSDKNIFFIVDDKKFILQENEEIIEKREGKYYIFPTERQIIICSEDADEEHLRVAVYRADNYRFPQKVKVKISKHIDLKSFPYEINFVDITSQKMLINIIRHNTITDKKESVISIYRIHEGFKVRYDQNIITTPKYFGEVCVDSETDNFLVKPVIQGYKFIPYDDATAFFNNIRIYIRKNRQGEEILIYKNLNDPKILHEKIIKGKITDFEKMEWDGECISYLEKNNNQTYLKFIFDETKEYLSFLFDFDIICKYTLYSTIYCLEKDKITTILT